MRSAKDTDNFPYTMNTLCYFEAYRDGTVHQVPHKNKSDKINVVEAYKKAKSQEVTLYAVWPGSWSSDLFIIDDLGAFAKEFGID